MSEKFKIIHMPPKLNQADAEDMQKCEQMLATLQEEYQKSAKPIIEQMASINARYAPRIFMVKSPVESATP